MNAQRFRTLYALVIASLLASCSGAQPVTRTFPLPAQQTRKASTTYGDLLYVAMTEKGVQVYTYPALYPVNTLDYGGTALCSDSSGNVYVVERSEINEFAHGGTTPINTLHSSSTGVLFRSCSVDPKSGNLAASVGTGIAIFKNAHGKPKMHTDPGVSGFTYCAYDGSGNLFADGPPFLGGAPRTIAVMSASNGMFTNYMFPDAMKIAGQMQWDGSYMTIVAKKRQHYMYRIALSGKPYVTIVDSISLDGSGGTRFQTWIYNGAVIVPFHPRQNQSPNNVGVWNYPAGGSPTETFLAPGFNSTPEAVTVSVAPTRK